MVELVKSGELPCTEAEKKQLLDAFDYSTESSKTPRALNAPNREVEVWPELADQWLKELFGKKENNCK